MGKYLHVAFIVVFRALLTCAVPLENTSLGGLLMKCYAGPTVWCSDLGYAKACNAVNHCIQTVWSKTVFPKDESPSCVACNVLVARAQFRLSQDQDVNDLFNLVRLECSKVLIADVREKCNQFAENYLTEFGQLLASNMNEAQKCAAIGFCRDLNNNPQLRVLEIEDLKMEDLGYEEAEVVLIPNNENVETLKHDISPAENAVHSNKIITILPTCWPCKTIVMGIQKLMKGTISKDQFTSILSVACYLSPFKGLREECQTMVQRRGGWMFDLIVKKSSAKLVCKLILMCDIIDEPESGDIADVSRDVLNYQDFSITNELADPALCGLCRRYIRLVKIFVNMMQSEFKEILDLFCANSPEIKESCTDFVDKNYDMIFKSLVNILDGSSPCTVLAFCPRIDEDMITLLNENYKEMSTNNEVAEPSSFLTCMFCRRYIKFVQKMIESKGMHSQLKLTFDAFCANSPEIRESCTDFVDKNYEMIYKSLVNILDGPSPCTVFGFCSNIHEDVPWSKDSDEEFTFRTLNIPNTEIVETIDNDITASNSNMALLTICRTCKHLMKSIQTIIKSFISKDKFTRTIEKGCYLLLTKAMHDKCQEVVAKYAPKLADFIYNQNSPLVLCKKIRFCRVEDQAVEAILSDEIDDIFTLKIGSNLRDLPICTACKLLMNGIGAEINATISKDEVIRLLGVGCYLAPFKRWRERCQAIIKEYGGNLYNFIVHPNFGKAVCRLMLMCSPEVEEIENDGALESEPNHQKHPLFGCSNCTNLVKKTKAILNGKISQSEILHALEKACTEWAEPQILSCDMFIWNYRRQLVDSFINSESPDYLCNSLHQCDHERTCAPCKFVMEKLDAFMRNPYAEWEIKRVGERMCLGMPKFAVLCQTIVHVYGTATMKLIGAALSDHMCQWLQMCPRETFVNVESNDCNVCLRASMNLLPYLKQGQTPLESEQSITLACANMPNQNYKTCADFISNYGQSISALAGKVGSDESRICAIIGKCLR